MINGQVTITFNADDLAVALDLPQAMADNMWEHWIVETDFENRLNQHLFQKFVQFARENVK